MKEYSRGSEWRRWDLHIHTASSYDAYKGDDSDKLLADAMRNPCVRLPERRDNLSCSRIKNKSK